jgi:hypothetical protein
LHFSLPQGEQTGFLLLDTQVVTITGASSVALIIKAASENPQPSFLVPSRTHLPRKKSEAEYKKKETGCLFVRSIYSRLSSPIGPAGRPFSLADCCRRYRRLWSWQKGKSRLDVWDQAKLTMKSSRIKKVTPSSDRFSSLVMASGATGRLLTPFALCITPDLPSLDVRQ